MTSPATGAAAAVTDAAIPATDGFALAASTFEPVQAPRLVVLLVPATGVMRSVYAALAAWLAARGSAAVTWDWRGTGGSRPPSLRGFAASMREHWAQRDFAGVIAWAATRFPGTPLTAVAHSFGGQALGLTPNAALLRAAVTVAAQSGYWGHWRPPAAWRYALLWYVAMPALTHMLGYFPARFFRLGEDLPHGVALQWARWCRTPDYLGDYTGHARFTAPLLVYGFSDDPYASPRAVDWLHARYSGARQERRRVTPGDLGVGRIGHFGFFRPEAAALWREAAAWLEARVAATV